MAIQITRLSMLSLLFLATPSLALAQTAATSLTELRLLVRNGDSVSVVDAAGTTLTGRIGSLSGSSLRLLVDGQPQDFTPANIREINRRGGDSLANGALIGMLVGAGFGLAGVVAASSCDGCYWESAAVPVVLVGLYGAMGAGVGVGIDALVRGRRVIYSAAPTGMTVRLSPILGHDRNGAFVAIGF